MKAQELISNGMNAQIEVIKVQSITKIYNPTSIPVNALSDVNLSIKKGEFTAIVGPSGCGKTTLLNMIGGLDKPTQGQVTLAGTRINELRDNQLINFRLHNIGFVFQASNLIPVLTVGENIGFLMQLKQLPNQIIKQRVHTLLQEIDLLEKAKQRPKQLSGGQQQKVAIARALASKPQFILADEPTANLDSKSTTTLLDLMCKLNRDEGITFVFSTHDPRVIERAKRIVTLEDGKIIQDKIHRKGI